MWTAWSPVVILCTTRSKKLWFLRRLARVAVPAALPDCRIVTSLNTSDVPDIRPGSGPAMSSYLAGYPAG